MSTNPATHLSSKPGSLSHGVKGLGKLGLFPAGTGSVAAQTCGPGCSNLHRQGHPYWIAWGDLETSVGSYSEGDDTTM